MSLSPERHLRSGGAAIPCVWLMIQCVAMTVICGASEMIQAIGSLNAAPYRYVESGTPAGLDVEVFESVARAGGLEATEVLDIGSAGVRDDAAVYLGNSLTTCPESHILTLPYARTSHTLFKSRDSLVGGLQDLRQKTILVSKSDPELQEYLRLHGFGARLREVATVREALKGLESGEIEAAIVESAGASRALAAGLVSEGALKLVLTDIAPYGRSLGVPKGKPELFRKLERGIRTLERTGQLDRMMVGHLGGGAEGQMPRYLKAGTSVGFIPVFVCVVLVLGSVLVLLRYKEFKERAIAKITGQQAELDGAKVLLGELRAEISRQKFVINRISATTLVDEVAKAGARVTEPEFIEGGELEEGVALDS